MSDISEIRAHPQRGEHYVPKFVGNAVITHVDMQGATSNDLPPIDLPRDEPATDWK